MIPKMTSGRKYSVQRSGDTPRTFWKLSLEDISGKQYKNVIYNVTISKFIQPKNRMSMQSPKPGAFQILRGIMARDPNLCSTQINRPRRMMDRIRRKMIYHVLHPLGASAE
jgi:hypothetical protein